MRRDLGADHFDTLTAQMLVGARLMDLERREEAERLLLDTLATARQVVKADHPRVLETARYLAKLYDASGRHAKAAVLFREVFEGARRVKGEEHSLTLYALRMLSQNLEALGRYDEAEQLFLESIEVQSRVLGSEHPQTLVQMANLADLYKKTGQMDKARPVVRELLAFRRNAAERPDAGSAEKNAYAWLLLSCEPANLRDPRAALELALDANEMTGFDEPALLDTLALAYHRTGNAAKAIDTQKKAISLVSEPESRRRIEFEDRLREFEKAIEGTPR